MAQSKPFEFLIDLRDIVSGKELAERARRAEQTGYHEIVFPDHLIPQVGPITGLAWVAAATETIRIAAFVFNNDLRHPVVLAQELASLDVLSDGRLDVAIGAGWNVPEYQAIGLPFDPTPVRQARLVEAIQVMKGCFGDGPFSFDGEHYAIAEHDGQPKPVQRPHPPFMIGGGGRKTLELAGREAQIVSLAPRIRPDRKGDPRSITFEATAEKIAWVKAAAGERFDALTLNVFRRKRPSPSRTTHGPNAGRSPTRSAREPAPRSPRTSSSSRRRCSSARSTASSRSSRWSASGSGSRRSCAEPAATSIPSWSASPGPDRQTQRACEPVAGRPLRRPFYRLDVQLLRRGGRPHPYGGPRLQRRERPLVLVAAQDPALRRLVAGTLAGGGFACADNDRLDGPTDAVGDLFPDAIVIESSIADSESGRNLTARARDESVPMLLLGDDVGPSGVLDALDEQEMDDYLLAPFHPIELVARVRALVRRRGLALASGPRRVGSALVDLDRREIRVGGRVAFLSRPDWAIAALLLAQRGVPVGSDQLVAAGWGSAFRDDVDLVRNSVRRIRRALGTRPGDPGPIRSVRGIGYVLEPEA